MSDAIEVEPYAPGLEAEWDAFVERGRNGTVFHSRRFLAYHPGDRFEDASLLFRREGRLVAVLPAAWREDDDLGRLLQSHPGASYGGPVFGPGARTHTVDAVVAALVEHTRAAGGGAIRMRLPPRVFHRPPLEELDFVLRFHDFGLWRSELSMYVRVDAADDEALLGSLGSACRRAVRKAIKSGLAFGESDDLEQYWQILAENLKRRYGVAPTHSLDELLRLRELLPGAVRLFAAREDDAILAGVLVFVCNDEAAHTFYLASREEAQDRRPLNLALYAAMGAMRSAGLRRLNFGVSTPDGESVNWGLLAFKESFGAHGICRETYQRRLAGGGARRG